MAPAVRSCQVRAMRTLSGDHAARYVVLVTVIAGTLACASGGEGSTTSAVSIDSIPLVDIGDAADGPHAEFSGFLQTAWLSDGRIAVANGGSHEVRIFDSTGNWLQTIGRRGAGPGEFESLGGLYVGRGDTLRTYDFSLLRVSVFSPEGEFQRGVRMGTDGGGGTLRLQGVLGNGSLVASTQKPIDMNSEPGVRRDTSTLILFDADGTLLESLGQFPGGEAWISRTGRRVSVQNRPFGKELFVIARDSSIYVGSADGPELSILKGDGSVERVIRWSAPARAVTPEIIDTYVATTIDQVDEDRRALYTEMLRSAPFPSEMPAYADVLVGSDGSVWVGRYVARGQGERKIFDVFDSSGAPLGSFAMPLRFTPSQVSADRVMGIWRDEDDVSHVRVYGFRALVP